MSDPSDIDQTNPDEVALNEARLGYTILVDGTYVDSIEVSPEIRAHRGGATPGGKEYCTGCTSRIYLSQPEPRYFGGYGE